MAAQTCASCSPNASTQAGATALGAPAQGPNASLAKPLNLSPVPQPTNADLAKGGNVAQPTGTGISEGAFTPNTGGGLSWGSSVAPQQPTPQAQPINTAPQNIMGISPEVAAFRDAQVQNFNQNYNSTKDPWTGAELGQAWSPSVGVYQSQGTAPQSTAPNTSTSTPTPTTGGNMIVNPTTGTGSQAIPSIPFGDVQRTLDTSNVPQLVSGEALQKAMMDAQQAAYNQASAYLDPQFANREAALKSSLVNQGIPQNSEAWNRAMGEFSREREFAYGQARNAAVQQGNAAQAQLFGQGLSANQNQFGQNLAGGQFGNAAQAQLAQQILAAMGFGEQQSQNNFANSLALRNQDINELLLQQQNPLQMLNALLSGNQVQSPNFSQTPGTNMANTDIAGIINQALGQQNNVYNAQMGNYNSNLSGASSLAGTAMMAFAI